MKILLACPRGFCAGVVRAVDIVEIALRRFGPPLYVRKEIVHNQAVVENLRSRGVVFVNDLSEVPSGRPVIFSAHGVSPAVREEARRRDLKVVDATCPLVTKVHLEARRYLNEGYAVALIGHRSHEEVEGTLGEAPGRIQLVENEADVPALAVPSPERLMILTQTTLSMNETQHLVTAIRRLFPLAQTPPQGDICYATQNRQDAVKEMVRCGAEMVLVVGSQNSSNSRRLAEVARQAGARNAYLIDRASEVRPEWLKGVSAVGLTAGASAPEYLAQDVVSLLKDKFNGRLEEIVVREENVHFALPRELGEDIP